KRACHFLGQLETEHRSLEVGKERDEAFLFVRCELRTHATDFPNRQHKVFDCPASEVRRKFPPHSAQKSPLPLFSKEGLRSYGQNAPFEIGGPRVFCVRLYRLQWMEVYSMDRLYYTMY